MSDFLYIDTTAYTDAILFLILSDVDFVEGGPQGHSTGLVTCTLPHLPDCRQNIDSFHPFVRGGLFLGLEPLPNHRLLRSDAGWDRDVVCVMLSHDSGT